jgi:cytochrome c556
MKIRTLLGAGALSAAAITAAFGHGGATGIVKERMDAMSVMGDAVKSLSAMMRGETPYDAEAIRAEAGKIRQHAGESITRLFPEGSGGGPSEAKAEIWSSWDDFAAMAEELELLADGLARAADNGLMQGGNQPGAGGMMGSGSGMMGGQSAMMGAPGGMDAAALAAMPADGVFNMMAQTCSACHTKFRTEKN